MVAGERGRVDVDLGRKSRAGIQYRTRYTARFGAAGTNIALVSYAFSVFAALTGLALGVVGLKTIDRPQPGHTEAVAAVFGAIVVLLIDATPLALAIIAYGW